MVVRSADSNPAEHLTFEVLPEPPHHVLVVQHHPVERQFAELSVLPHVGVSPQQPIRQPSPIAPPAPLAAGDQVVAVARRTFLDRLDSL